MRIKDLREEKNFNQKFIADILCITQAQYSRIENGINELSYQGLIQLSYIYNTSIDYILGITDEIKPYKRKKRN